MANTFSASDFALESDLILKECSQAFSQETIDYVLKEKILLIKSELIQLRNSLILAKEKTNRNNLTANMKIAYLTIMKFRTLLLGESSTINYRLYIRGSSLDKVRVIDIPESKIMSLVERSGDSLRLRRTFGEIDAIYNNTEVQALFDQHFKNISNSFKHISGNNYVVPFSNVRDIISTRVGQSNLYWQDQDGPRGKSAYTPKFFNRGWIYQAFDATINDLYKDQSEEISISQFRYAYFTKHLAYDNVIGFKGGDVGLNQIKSNMANLINITSLINYLEIIDNILNPINFQNSLQLSEYIKSKFTTQENLSVDIANYTDQIADKLFQTLNLTK